MTDRLGLSLSPIARVGEQQSCASRTIDLLFSVVAVGRITMINDTITGTGIAMRNKTQGAQYLSRE